MRWPLRHLLTVLLCLTPCLSAAEDALSKPPTDTPPTEDQPAAPTSGDEAPAEPIPEHRARPRTAKEEEDYKRKAVREDPYLNAPQGPPAGALAFYKPSDWLRFDFPYDRSRYLIQDGTGAVKGFLDIDSESQVGPLGNYIHARLDYEWPQKHVEMWLDNATFKPKTVVLSAPPETTAVEQLPVKTKRRRGKRVPAAVVTAAPPVDAADPNAASGAPPDATALRTTHIEYLFDRITIERDAGVVATQEHMRQLPYSFDVEQVPLLVRQLDFSRLDKQWPFEALATDAEHHASLPLHIDKPRIVSVSSAEPQTYSTYQLTMKLGDGNWTWWVERAAPFRLVKFSDGKLTYTLHQYEPPPQSY